MKILFEIDQVGSIRNGEEAYDSTELVDVPVSRISPELRELIISHGWDPKHKRVSINDKIPVLVKPYTVSDAIMALLDLLSPLRGKRSKK